MKNLNLWLGGLLALLTACTAQPGTTKVENVADPAALPTEVPDLQRLSSAGANACCAYWTEDASGNPVLCWSESPAGEENYQLRFARYDAARGEFEEAGRVAPSTGMQAHGESMAKLAYKQDGTVLAIFRRKSPTPENRFAGSVFYALSQDDGASWSAETKLVADPASQSQSFFDLARLPNGELGMVWLDGRRLVPDKPGSTLYFAQTEPGGAFAPEVPIDGTTCQCCRTDLYATEDGNLHVAFRDILQDTIRDMVYLVSEDGGRHWAAPVTISPDNWVIDGCPHTGPSLARNGLGLGVSWYTQGGHPGVYFNLHREDGVFSQRELVQAGGGHPQLVALGEEGFAIALENFVTEAEGPRSQILLCERTGSEAFTRAVISGPEAHATFPVLRSLPEGQLLAAWTQARDTLADIVFRKVAPAGHRVQ